MTTDGYKFGEYAMLVSTELNKDFQEHMVWVSHLIYYYRLIYPSIRIEFIFELLRCVRFI